MDAELSEQFPQLAAFLEAVEPTLAAYRHGLLSYVAIVHAGETVLLRAAVRLSVEPSPLPKHMNQTLNLRCGQRRLETNPRAVESWIRAAVSGDWLPMSTDPLMKLMPDHSRRYSASHESTPQPLAHKAKDPERLWISGAGRSQLTSVRHRAFDRELNEIGFDTFDELMRALGLEASDQTTFEISAAPVARIESASLQGTRLQIVATLARDLDKDRLRVTVRNADLSDAPLPHSFSGSDLDWIERDGSWIATLNHELASNAVIVCRAVYAGRIQDEIRLCDPNALPNSRRMILNVIDPELQRIRKLLTHPTDKQRDDFETAVALLFQMLGFAPAPIGKLSGMSGEPDMFIAGTDSEMLVVECTTDVPDDDKLMKLVSRAARARDVLARSSSSIAYTVLPVLIVPLRPEELRPIRAKADAHGVLILCRPEIEAAIARTEFAPDASEVLRQWRNLPLVELLTRGLDGRQ